MFTIIFNVYTHFLGNPVYITGPMAQCSPKVRETEFNPSSSHTKDSRNGA